MRTRLSNVRTVLFLVASATLGALASAQAPVPDLTRGGLPDESHDWNLGPTGARGWIAGRNCATLDARQILVTSVDPGSPAEGVLKPGDVIVGVDGREFASDARRAFGEAITEAERVANRGALRVLRWRKGRTEPATLQLEVMGDYADTAPYDDAKSRKILERATRHLMEVELQDSVSGAVDALALLATGRPDCIARVKPYARRVGPKDLDLTIQPGMYAWPWGFTNLFLTEYHLATGDDSVLPAIREYSKEVASGQSSVGTWGHGMVVPGRGPALGGYGALNQAGAVCWLSLILAEKCGVKDAVVRQAIERSRRFFDFYTGKGSIPYGDHAPYQVLHDNNGKNALVALGFDWLGDDASSRFFARMSTASYDERELGHTGNYFGFLFGPLGVASAGREAVARHLEEQRWFYDLARRADGSFVYQGGAGEDDSYAGWDTTGAFLLTYALPQQELYVTGKGIDAANALKGAELEATIRDGREFDPWRADDGYRTRKTSELLESLGSWSPTVRYRAAKALALREADVVQDLKAMLRSDDLQSRYGACQALEYLEGKGAPAVDALIDQLAHEDAWLQIRAACALAGIGGPARKALPEILKLALAPSPGDPRHTTRRYLGLVLFLNGYVDGGPRRGMLADGIEGVDEEILLAAIRAMLETDDGLVRAQVSSVYEKLDEEQLDRLWPDILRAVQQRPPSGEMFAEEIRVAGLQLMARHRIREGMQACVAYAKNQNQWGSENRMGEILACLAPYGAHARELLPDLRDLATYCREEQDFPDDCKRKKTAAVEAAIAAISAAKERPELRSMAPTAPTKSAGSSRRLKVFVLAGQSNMQGPAVADLDPAWNAEDYNEGRGTLQQVMKVPANRARYRHLADARGQWTIRKDVFVRYQLEDGPLKCGPLAPGFSPHSEHHFGPELQFGHVVGDWLDEPVLLVKTAWGGKSLYVDFRPPSAGGEVGPYYTRMIAEVRDALANVSRDLPSIGVAGCDLAGFVWYQGWNDGCDPEHAVPEYEENLVHLIRDVRRDLGAPNLPVVIGELTGPWVKAEGEWDTLRKAQAAAATRPEFAGNVKFVETHDFVRKPEDSPHPGHGHHEFGNAETYFLVGDALGQAMKAIVGKKARK